MLTLAIVFASLFKFFTTKGLSIEESIDKANYEMTIDPNNDLNKVHPSKVIFFMFIIIIKNQFLKYNLSKKGKKFLIK